MEVFPEEPASRHSWLTYSRPGKAPERGQHLPRIPTEPCMHGVWNARYLSSDHNSPGHKGFGWITSDAWKSKV